MSNEPNFRDRLKAARDAFRGTSAAGASTPRDDDSQVPPRPADGPRTTSPSSATDDPAAPHDPSVAKATRKAMRPWYRKKRWIAAMAFALLVFLFAVSPDPEPETTETTAPAAAPSAPADEPTREPVSEDEPEPEPDPEPVSAFEEWAATIDPSSLGNCSMLSSLIDDAHTRASAEGSDAEALIDFERAALDRMDEVCEDEPAPEEEPESADDRLEIGDGVTLTTDGEDSEVLTVRNVTYSTTPADKYGSGPKRKVFVIFKVRIDGLASTSVYEDDFYIVTKDGRRIDQGDGNSWDAVDLDETLGFAEVNAGQHKTGLLVFDSPVRHGTLAYDPNFEGEPVVSWKF